MFFTKEKTKNRVCKVEIPIKNVEEIRKKIQGVKDAYFPVFKLIFFELKGKGNEPSQKILQLELWLESAWLGLILNVCMNIDVLANF